MFFETIAKCDTFQIICGTPIIHDFILVLKKFNEIFYLFITEAILHINAGQKDYSDLLENVTEFSQTLIHKSPKRHPTVFILDKEIQGLPWESLGCLQNHSITRVPSIHQLISLYFTQTKNAQSVPNVSIFFQR